LVTIDSNIESYMKKALFFFILIAQFSCNSSISQKNGWGKYNVNGKVEEMLTTTYKAINKNGHIEPDESKQIYKQDIVFDSAGYITESYVTKLNLLYVSSYKKGSNQLLLTLGPLDNDTVIYTNGVADSIITKEKNGTLYNRSKLKVDKEGNIIERVKKDANNRVIETIKTEYEDGVIVSESVFDSTGRLFRKTESKTRSNGRIKSTRILNDNVEVVFGTFEYSDPDEFGNWTKKLEYDKSGKVVRITRRGFLYYGRKEKGMR
jgi:hypothetical protein